MHPLLSASITKSPKPRTSASCLAKVSSKSTTSAPILSRVVGTPVTFYTRESQVLRELCIAIRHSRSSSDSTLVDPSPPPPTIPSPSPSGFPLTVPKRRNREAKTSQGSRESTLPERSDSDFVHPTKVSDACQGCMAGAIKTIIGIQETKWTERLRNVVAEAKAAKDAEWADRLKETVAKAEAAKDKELETFDQVKEFNHSNDIQDLKEDHEHEIKELEEQNATDLEELNAKHAEEVQQLIRKHGLEARKLQKRLDQGAKEAKQWKEKIIEMEAEKLKTEENLVYMTGQRDALSNAFAAMKGQSSSQAIKSLEPSYNDQHHKDHHGETENTNEIVDDYSRTITGADAVNKTKTPATGSGSLETTRQAQNNHSMMIRKYLYPRIQLLESENAQLRIDLDQRHEDVAYAVKKADRLRALLDEDPTKADTYADILVHKEMIEELRTQITASHEAVELEKLESQRLRDRIDLMTADMQRETLERQLAVKDKEAAWVQNETLLNNLKGPFYKNDFDNAFWAHCEALGKQKETLEHEVDGIKRERSEAMEEVVDLKAYIARIQLEYEIGGSGRDEDGVQELKSRILTLQVSNDVLKAELEFRIAEEENRKERSRLGDVITYGDEPMEEGKGSRRKGIADAVEKAGDVESDGVTTPRPSSDYGFF